MPSRYKTISVVGLGYIGLPTAAAFASRKINVIGVDINPCTVETVNNGQVHIVEPELDMIVHAAVTEGYLRATTKPEAADAFLIAVPTPFVGDYQPDLSYVQAASEAVANVLKAGDLVILESTSPVGSTEKMAEWMAAIRPDLTFPQQAGEHSDIRIAHCPERVLPGQVMRELIENDRIIGGMTDKCSAAAVSLYRIILQGKAIITNVRTAEMCKLTENAYRDVNIAFANELSIICDGMGVDVWELIRLANHHPRVNILNPGCGVGGHCIAVDPWFIISQHPSEANLMRVARETNNAKPLWVIEQLRKAVEEQGKPEAEVSIAILGLAFKPNIDDLRESPALAITHDIVASHPGNILVVEPHIDALPDSLIRENTHFTAYEDAIAQADIVLALVAHSAFAQLRRQLTPRHLIIDAAGLLTIVAA